jgi:hypothetical protein
LTRLGSGKESDLKSSILDFLQIYENKGLIYSDRLNSGKLLVLNKDGSQRLVNLCKEGTADIFFIAYGRVIFVETKCKNGKQRESQKEFQSKVESVGALYWLVDNFQAFLDLFQEVVDKV